jgi:hypothetical protein
MVDARTMQGPGPANQSRQFHDCRRSGNEKPNQTGSGPVTHFQENTTMKVNHAFLVLAGLASASVLAQSRSEWAPQAEPPVTPMTRIEAKTENGITYVCGGVGEREAVAMKQAASDYDMMLTFAAANGAYLADVNVDIADARGRSMLTASCDAPIMLVDFERSGTYRVRAESEGHTLNRTAQIRNEGKVKTVAMAWPIDVVDMGVSPTLSSAQSSGGSGASDGGSDASGSR